MMSVFVAKAVTVISVEALMLPILALMVVVPMETALARPCVPGALDTAAMVVMSEAHTTLVVRFLVVLSEYVPVAVNCTNPPTATLGLTGVTAIDTSSSGADLDCR